MLVRLLGDASYWAYLITAPAVWNDRVERWVASAFKDHEPGYEAAWMSQPKQWDYLLDVLFLTKKELVG